MEKAEEVKTMAEVIKSDRSGRGIHSPYVYRLVANVLFPGYPYYAYDEIGKLEELPLRPEELKIIFNLVNFISPAEIRFVGEARPVLKKVCAMAKSTLFFTEGEPDAGSEVLRIVFFNGTEKVAEPEPPPRDGEVWVVTGPGIKDNCLFFESRAQNAESGALLRLNRMAIVLFNKKLPGQCYVIKH